MSYEWMMCLECGHLIRKRLVRNPYRIRKQQCGKCWSTNITAIPNYKIEELVRKGFEVYYKRRLARIPKEQSERTTAPKPKPHIEKMVPIADQVQEPKPQHPECFGIKMYLANNQGIDLRDCFECEYRSECRKKVLSK